MKVNLCLFPVHIKIFITGEMNAIYPEDNSDTSKLKYNQNRLFREGEISVFTVF